MLFAGHSIKFLSCHFVCKSMLSCHILFCRTDSLYFLARAHWQTWANKSSVDIDNYFVDK